MRLFRIFSTNILGTSSSSSILSRPFSYLGGVFVKRQKEQKIPNQVSDATLRMVAAADAEMRRLAQFYNDPAPGAEDRPQNLDSVSNISSEIDSDFEQQSSNSSANDDHLKEQKVLHNEVPDATRRMVANLDKEEERTLELNRSNPPDKYSYNPIPNPGVGRAKVSARVSSSSGRD